jgi:uncharacterized membrane protein YgdD (TMEM256/DUF423 family)
MFLYLTFSSGAHAIKAKPETMKDIWKTASSYHLIHTCALAIAATQITGSSRKKNLVCSLFATGILLFSGSLYVVVLMDNRKPYSYPAPVGGIILVLGWLALGFM